MAHILASAQQFLYYVDIGVCEEHNISGDDRQSRLKLGRHFNELVNGKSPTAVIFLNLTGGKPLVLAVESYGGESDR
ncbi:MAG: hypothetical protein WCE81_09015 [Halobacteriota archaeon]